MTDPAGPARAAEAPQSPWAIFRHHFSRSRPAVAGLVVLVVFYAAAIAAPFLSPYPPDVQYRDQSFAPPSKLHLRDAAGRWHLVPFVYPLVPSPAGDGTYVEDTSLPSRLKFLKPGEPYHVLGLTLHRRLVGVDEPARLFLGGTDIHGRDVFTRILYGSRISLSVGLIGVAITFAIGLLVGAIAGYYGGAVDTVLMRFSELLLSMPFLYLILALRAAFPSSLPSAQMYLLIIVLLAFIGWAGLARIVRGMVLSLRKNEYVLAARALGYSTPRILVRHVLPNTLSFTIVAASVSIPTYILGEVVLSFLGAGIQEPTPSWGNMLNAARSVDVLTNRQWMLLPGLAIFVTVMAFNFLGDGLRDALDPRRIQGS